MFLNPSRLLRSIGIIVLLGLLLSVGFISTVSAQSPAPLESVNSQVSVNYPDTISLGMVFTAFFLMLGPVKIVVPFAQVTAGMEESAAVKVALRAIGFAVIIGIVAAFIGQRTLVSWEISLPALHLAAGIILFLVSLRSMLALYAPAQDTANSKTPHPNPALSPLAFPTILSPYGIAILILFLVISRNVVNDLYIFGIFLIVMLLNLATMRFARAIVRYGGTVLAILGAVIGVLLVALSVQMILDALRFMQVLPVP
jgi:multiple antibiotic resistance protein